MNVSASYELQRQYLRLRLQANRLLFEQYISGQTGVDDEEFPRSVTMRFLSTTPGIFTFLVADVAPFLLSKYLARRRNRN